NGVAERKNKTLIEAARTMLADSKLPTMFWTEAVSTACYVLNRVSITNPYNKTPYELISGKVPQIGHLKPFGCQVTIFNTSDHSGKIEGKPDEGYWKRIFRKGRKTKPKTTKLGTEWNSVKRRSQIEAKKSTKSKSQQESQTVKVKVKRKSKSEEI
ncbi:putative ribonuclease H-like domain-containing protein, partial [Tanacetum coccineum]